MIKCVLCLLAMTGAVPAPAANALNYWAAPAAAGTGDGSSLANAAYYLNSSFWSAVQSQLQSINVNVNLLDGNYNAGLLALTDMGNPLHRLTLQAANRFGPVFSPTSDHILDLTGTQNAALDGLVFNGPTPYWGIVCQPDYLKPCRNIGIYNCRFLNLTNAYYGAIGLLNGTRMFSCPTARLRTSPTGGTPT